jgi:N-acetylglucosamine malate deacetylase 1
LTTWKESEVRRYVAITKMIVASIGAHPDDVELGMGGTLAKHSKRGDEIHIITCTLGIGGISGDPKIRERWKQAIQNLIKLLWVITNG